MPVSIETGCVMKTAAVFLRVMLAGVLLFAVAGCTDDTTEPETTSEEAASDDAATETGGAGDESAAGEGGWLDGIPATVPQFPYGIFDEEESSEFQAGPQTLYSLYYDEVAEADFEAYLDSLEAAGLSVVPENVTDGASAYGELVEGDNKVLGYVIAWQTNGHVDYTITVLPAQ